MRAPLRRPLGIAVLLMLLMSIAMVSPAAVLGRGPTSTTVRGIDVDATTIPELQALMDAHKLTSVQLTQFYLHRIKKLNPVLHAVITTSSTALADARAADKARRKGDDRPLLGIPIIVKDNINTTGMPTTAGSWALAGSSPTDAFIVQQLRAAGAIVIGKANLSEWANFRSIPSSSGWSGIGGQTNLAYVLDRNPCGSSSGSGVVASADLAVAAVGTETDGSIVCPSGANSLVGIKPTLGLLSRAGIIPISADQDTAGPMARNVTDAAVLLGALTGVDPADPATAGQVVPKGSDYTPFLDATALDGATIGFLQQGTSRSGGRVPRSTRSCRTRSPRSNHRVRRSSRSRSQQDDVFGPEFDALLCEFKTDIATYLETYTGRRLSEVARGFDRLQRGQPGHRRRPGQSGPSMEQRDLRGRGGHGRPRCELCRSPGGHDPGSAGAARGRAEEADAIIAPTNGPPWVTDPVNGDLGGDFSTFVGSSIAVCDHRMGRASPSRRATSTAPCRSG